MLRLLPLPIFICIYLLSWWRCKKNIIASDKQLKPCIDWAYIKNLPLPPKPSFVEFYIVYVYSFFKFPFNYSTTTFCKESKILRKRNEINI